MSGARRGGAWIVALAGLAACVEPGSISDPEAIISRIQDRDGGLIDVDGGTGPFPVPGVDSGGPAASDPCDTVLEDYIVPTCSSSPACHGSGAALLDLESPMHAMRLVGTAASAACPDQLYVDPDAPEDSLILTKLGDSPPCGSPMPFGGTPATAAEKACMLSWVRGLIDGAGPSATPDAGNMSMPDAGGMPDAAMADAGGNDLCPADPDKTEPGLCGCGMPDVDSDGDAVLDCSDGCPDDMAKTSPGNCGCGVPEMDPCVDGCPNDPNKDAPGQCGCGTADDDGDSDGTADCNDGCPADPNKTAAGTCGCGTADTDTDADGTPNCNDGCPNNADATVAPCGGVAGLLVGAVNGDFNTTTANSGTEGIDAMGPTISENVALPENTTYVLTGEIYVPAGGTLWFYENFDDSVLLTIDGTEILNDGVWDMPTIGSITRTEGWYSFELRLGNGVSASGPPTGIGFGYTDVDPGGSTDPADYGLPRNTDTTTGDLFRVP